MNTHQFAVQASRGAFNHNDDVPAGQWDEISRHTTLTAARRRQNREIAEMHEAVGSTGWSTNYQIVALRDTQIVYSAICYGPSVSNPNFHVKRSPNCHDSVSVTVQWPEGEPTPREPQVAPWPSWTICPACYVLEQEAQARADAYEEKLAADYEQCLHPPLPTLTCLRCGRTWHPQRDGRPGVCPECKSYSWDKPRRTPKA